MTTDPYAAASEAIDQSVVERALNERNEGGLFGEALMDALCEAGLGRDLPAEEWDDVLVTVMQRLLDAGWRVAPTAWNLFDHAYTAGYRQSVEDNA